MGSLCFGFCPTHYVREQRAGLFPASSPGDRGTAQGLRAAAFKQGPAQKGPWEEAAVCLGLICIRTRWAPVAYPARVWGSILKPLNIWASFFLKAEVSEPPDFFPPNLVWRLCKYSRRCCHQFGLMTIKWFFSIPYHMDADNMLATGFTVFYPRWVCGLETSLTFSTHLSPSCSEPSRASLSPGIQFTWGSPDLTKSPSVFLSKSSVRRVASCIKQRPLGYS